MLAQIAMLIHNANARRSSHKKLRSFLPFKRGARPSSELDARIIDYFEG